MTTTIAVASFNVRGIRERQKRRTVFRHLHLKYPKHVVCIQETHSSPEIEQQWRNEWGSEVIFSHGSVLVAGVAILLPRNFPGVIEKQLGDGDGRVAGVQFSIEKEKFTIVGVYAPAIDIQEQKINFF